MSIMLIPDLYPMKASDDEKRVEQAWNNPRYVCEIKWDGARYLIKHDLDGSVSVTSRQKSKQTGRPVDKTENVPHLVELAKKLPKGTVLDGEIVVNGGKCTSSEVTKIMGAKSDLALARQEKQGYVQYICYDVLYFDGQSVMNEEWWQRRVLLEQIVDEIIQDSRYVVKSYYVPCSEDGIAKGFYEGIVLEGGEGVILKDRKATYIPDKRPLGTWLKVKKYSTFDVVILGFTDATKTYEGKELHTTLGVWNYWEDIRTGEKVYLANVPNKDISEYLRPITKFYYYGWIGAVRFGQYNDKGELIEVGQTSGMDEATRDWFTRNKDKAIGMVIEVGAMEQIADTKALRHPRFLRFRGDKNPQDCIIGEC